MTESTTKREPLVDRRQFLQGAALLTASAVGSTCEGASSLPASPTHRPDQPASRIDTGVHVTHSVCLGCNARCGNRQVVQNGRLQSISGNPYHPYNGMGEPIDYATPVPDSINHASPVCGKAQDAISYVYNPRRLKRPLKRAGARGEGRFEEISWEQLVREVGSGGRLFSHLGEDRQVPGLKDCLSDAPIVPDDPSLGPKRNGFALITGRLQSGRKEFIDRFVKNAVGSVNRIGHTDICGLGFRMGNFLLTEGKQVELKADPWGAQYILVFGANIYEALQPGVNTYGAAVANRYSKKQVKFAIVDPRAQNAAVHAHDWIPVLPGQDGAFAMAMIRWIVDNGRYNHDYLSLPNPEAAKRSGYSSYANACHLVIDEPDHPLQGRFLRLWHLQDTGQEKNESYMVIDHTGNPVPYDSLDHAELEYEGTVAIQDRRVRVATAFTLMKRAARHHSLEDYSSRCGITTDQIKRTAQDFTSYGTKAAVCQYHGAGNYPNGTHAAFAVALLNVLIGSIGMKGGYLPAAGGAGSWKRGAYDLVNFPGSQKAAGVRISREKAVYENSSEYRRKKAATGSGYPASRPWPTFSQGGLSVEALCGIDAGYPYGNQVLFSYFYNPIYSTPGGYRFEETFKSPEKVPLHVSIDIGINESNIFADYIVPDVTYLEGQYGWLNPHAPALRFTGIRVPCLEPLTDSTIDGRPFCLETFLIDLAVSLELPGFGKDAIPGEDGTLHPLFSAEDFYLRAYANIAADAGLPPAQAEEIAFVEEHCPISGKKSMLSGQEWQQVAFMLARGGIFTPYGDAFDGDRFLAGIERVVLHNEDLATTRNSLTGERYCGTLQCLTPEDSAGRAIAEQDRDYPYFVVTHKMHVHTQSRTIWHARAMELFPENLIQVNSLDATQLAIASGDEVLLRSASNRDGVRGRVEVTECIRPGCIGISFHYGHRQLGANSITVQGAERVFLGGKEICDGDTLRAAPELGRGTNPNMVGRLDDHLAATPLVDVLAGIPDFSSTRVTMEKIA